MFAADSMTNLMSTSRKDDLESIMYLLCYLFKGTLPIIEYININIDNFQSSEFLKRILQYRIDNKVMCHDRIKSLLPPNMATAFTYINQLKHEDKPNYLMIKLWFAFSEREEQRAFKTKLKIKEEFIPLLYDQLFEHSFSNPSVSDLVSDINEKDLSLNY